jgi:hypothetical protein
VFVVGAGTTAFTCAAFAQGASPMPHIVLLGDSVFDNAAYVAGGPDVVHQLRAILPPGWRATLNARDGAVIADLAGQLQKLPAESSHLVASIGGNDALGEAALLDEGVTSMAEALELMTRVRERFQSAYIRMLDQLLETHLSIAVATIYEPRFPEPARRRVAATALTVLNDIVTRQAFARQIDLIDLRTICDQDADFANAIEPSVHGGAKIARAILDFALLPRIATSRVFARARR